MHQAFVLFSCCNDLIADFFRVDADATSEGHPEGFEGVCGLDELLFLEIPYGLMSTRKEPIKRAHSDNLICLFEPRCISRLSILLTSPLLIK